MSWRKLDLTFYMEDVFLLYNADLGIGKKDRIIRMD